MIITDKELLIKECKEVSLFEGQDIIQKLEKELATSEIPGIGLAANQIGIDAKVCIIRTKEFHLDLINPKIIEKFDLLFFKGEGCLSFPNRHINTKRFNDILVVDYLHPSGVVATGLEAIVIQHEVGHLYGETMFDYQIELPQGPNSKCWCGSGKKYKVCHSGKKILSL